MKITAISDTHWQHDKVKIPKTDILIHCGDAELQDFRCVQPFLNWFRNQPAKHKIFVPGNHDFEMQQHYFNYKLQFEGFGVHLLIDDEVIIDGIRFYGTPWTPFFNNWAFMREDGQNSDMVRIFSKIPNDVEVLITHGPAFDILDQTDESKPHLGSWALQERLKKLNKLEYHFFGHIHGGYGKTGIHYNCSLLDECYELVNKPITVKISEK